MRSFLLIPPLLLAASPVQSQGIGERTTSPEAMLSSLSGSPEDALAEQIAAANAHPLGTAANPVRVGGPEGERAYLARLRCSDGSAPSIGMREEAGVGAFGSVVGAYEVECGGSNQVRIVMDRYHAEHRETRAPPGFAILPL